MGEGVACPGGTPMAVGEVRVWGSPSERLRGFWGVSWVALGWSLALYQHGKTML